MPDPLWTTVNACIADYVLPPDPVLDHALQSSAGAGLPPIQVSPPLGQFLHLMARVAATTIQTVGSKGYDGFTFALVTAE